MKKTILMTFVCALTLSYGVDLHAKIYKWTDSKGVTHYSATPPPQKKKTKTKVKNIEDKIRFAAGKYRPSTSKNSEKNNKESGSEKEESKDSKLAGPDKKLVAYCKGQRDNLESLKQNYRNVWVDEKGNKKKLDQKARQQKVNYLIKRIAEDCDGI